MTTDRVFRRFALVAGGGALVAMGMLTAGCGSDTKEEPTTTTGTTSPSTSAPATLSPSEKAVGPGANNSFSPTVNPVPPGAVCREIVNGVCVR